MKRWMLMVFALGLFYTLQSQVIEEELTIDQLAGYEARNPVGNQIDLRNELTDSYDIKYHRLEWEVDPAEYYIKGKVTTYFVPREDNFSVINFDLASSYTNVEALFHEQSVIAEVHAGNNLRIELGTSLEAGHLDSISIIYEGAPPVEQFRSFVADSHNGIPQIWTLSEPYGAKDWWPCKQNLNDKIDSIDIIVTTPSMYRAASNGLLMSETENGGKKTYHWKHRYPIPAYLIAIGVTNYVVYSDFVPLDNGGSVEVLNYVYPESLEDAQARTGFTGKSMELFNELFITYPFKEEKYGHAMFGFGGGMEHQTMSFMGGFSDLLQAHELAHQWFGDYITCGSWEDIWLNEGFATYLEGLTKQYLYETQDLWENWKISNINSIVSQPGGSVWVNDTTSVGRIFDSRLSYKKGAMILHMLRWKLGDEVFFNGVKQYLNDPTLKYGYAKTKDLIRNLEEVSETDLTEFFLDWFYGEGYPVYQIEWWNTVEGVLIKINQQPSHPSVDFFEMDIPIEIKGSSEDTLIRIPNTFSGQEYQVKLDFKAEDLVFDPDHWLVALNQVNYLGTKVSEFDPTAITLSPNPVADFLIIEGVNMSASFKIYDGKGVLLNQSDIFESAPQLNVSSYPSGIYYIEILNNNENEVVKFVKI